MKVEIKFVDKWLWLTQGTLPRHGTCASAGMDLVACLEGPIIILPNKRVEIQTGISVHIADPGVAALILPRSGLACRSGIILGNSVGLIDSDYQGEIIVSLWNTGTSYTVSPGDYIAQMIFVPIIHPEFSIVDEFTASTERGTGGFGSTGR